MGVLGRSRGWPEARQETKLLSTKTQKKVKLYAKSKVNHHNTCKCVIYYMRERFWRDELMQVLGQSRGESTW